MTTVAVVVVSPLLIEIVGLVGDSVSPSFRKIVSLALEEIFPSASLNQIKTVLVPLPLLKVKLTFSEIFVLTMIDYHVILSGDGVTPASEA